jgi:tetratricopeptide (TPR) repeat protein
VRVALHPTALPAQASDVVGNLPELASGLGRIVVPVQPRLLAVAQDRSLVPGALALAAFATAAFVLSGVRRRLVLLGLAAYALLLAPSLFLPGTLTLDSRLYLPSVGVLLGVGAIVPALAVERRVLVSFAGVIVSVLALVTFAFEGAFRDPRAFGREAVAGSPHSSLAHFCLGQSYELAGNDELALAEYRTALALGPAEAVHNDIAVLAMKDARWDEAEQELGEELAINPRFARAHYNLGIVQRRQGRMAESCASEERAHALAPDDERIREERERDCAHSPGQ